MKPNKYTYLLFDLDHTLWDFNRNCEETLARLFDKYRLGELGIYSKKIFFKEYLQINNKLWSQYNKNELTKEEMREQRFVALFKQFRISNRKLALQIEDEYLQECPRNGRLIEGCIEVLDHLAPHYKLVIITNGFEESQRIKMEHSGLAPYFEHVFTSESVGSKKPSPEYFTFVLNELQADASECLVIGDNPQSDILGGNRAGIDTYWVNTQKFHKRMSSTFYADRLTQLKRIL